MTFLEAFNLYGPDTIAISEALDIPEHEADRLVSQRMDRTYVSRMENVLIRSDLREIRARRPA
jgi:hypothetical protein